MNARSSGVQLHISDREAFDPIRTAIAMIVTVRRVHPDKFAWRESSPPFWMDTLTGSDQVRKAIDGGASTDEVVAGWRRDLRAFRRLRERYLLYPRGRADGAA